MSLIKPSVKISKITLFNGQQFTFKADEKVIIVGPNNSGKSQILRDILEILGSNDSCSGVIIEKVELAKSTSIEMLTAYIKKFAKLKNEQYYLDDWSIYQSDLHCWNFENRLGCSLVKGFVKRIAADDRLNVCQQQDSVSPDDPKTKPQHLLYDDEELMHKVSSLFNQAFNKQLMFDFRGGKKLPIHVGNIPNGIQDRASNAYADAVRAQPLLDQQGDGMKSYAGILFESVVANKDMTLIDEPEAFLHPPQMRRLGEALATEVKGQLFLATHSSDILRGFLEGTKGNVRILRLQREGKVNTIHEASVDVLRELWTRPNLRYSNALDGTFYEQTIICEDDSDCRLIHAVADHLEAQSCSSWKDTAYIPAGGKDAIPMVAEVLRKIGVPIKAVFDLDFLSGKPLVEKTVKAFGGDWPSIESHWKIVDSGVRGLTKDKTPEAMLREIRAFINEKTVETFDKKELYDIMRHATGWQSVKKNGSTAIPSGDATTNFYLLVEKLESIGIYIVPVGEIENFSKETGSHGPKFVTKLLNELSLDDCKLKELRDFVEKIHMGKLT